MNGTMKKSYIFVSLLVCMKTPQIKNISKGVNGHGTSECIAKLVRHTERMTRFGSVADITSQNYMIKYTTLRG